MTQQVHGWEPLIHIEKHIPFAFQWVEEIGRLNRHVLNKEKTQ